MASILEPYVGTAAVAIQGDPEWHTAALISTEGNRWSRPGQPTIYLGGDPSLALAELARHLPAGDGFPPAWVWTVDVRLDAVVDLRSQDAAWVLDAERCRDVASDLRRRGAEGLIVPSVAFLDRADRSNLVIFAERIGELDRAISDPNRVVSIDPG
jgi:RES domain-containing protein